MLWYSPSEWLDVKPHHKDTANAGQVVVSLAHRLWACFSQFSEQNFSRQIQDGNFSVSVDGSGSAYARLPSVCRRRGDLSSRHRTNPQPGAVSGRARVLPLACPPDAVPEPGGIF